MVKKIMHILDEIKLKTNEDVIKSDHARNYLKIIRVTEMLEREKEKISALLDEKERKELFRAISKQYGVPYYVNVSEASEIMGISPQMVRRHCANGKLKAVQTLQGGGKWRIEADQLMDQPHWENYLKKRARIKLQSLNFANEVLDYLDDEKQSNE